MLKTSLRKKCRFIPCLIIVLIIIFPWEVSIASENTSSSISAIEEAMNYIDDYYFSKPDVDLLAKGALNGMLDALGDPYSEYFTPEELKRFTSDLEGEFTGIGVYLKSLNKIPVVIEVIPNSPAEKAGVKPGDKIIRVNKIDTTGLSLDEVINHIRGVQGTKAYLVIQRDGHPDFNLEIIRTFIDLPSVKSQILEQDIGYIAIRSFTNNTAIEFKTTLEDLINKKIASLILDLRDNPGGYLQSAVDIAGNFLESGKIVVITEERNENGEVYRTSVETPIARNLPLVLLVNKESASASELLAGAFQYYKRGKIIGERTYGKGTVQSIIPLKKLGGALKLTTAIYLTPENHSVQGVGVIPDHQVLTEELQVEIAKQFLHPVIPQTINFILGGQEVTLNGNTINLKAKPFLKNNQVYLPLRFVMEALGYQVNWEENGVLATGKGIELFLPVEKKSATLNKREVTLPASILLKKGLTYLPAEALEKLLNIKVNQLNNTVLLKSNSL